MSCRKRSSSPFWFVEREFLKNRNVLNKRGFSSIKLKRIWEWDFPSLFCRRFKHLLLQKLPGMVTILKNFTPWLFKFQSTLYHYVESWGFQGFRFLNNLYLKVTGLGIATVMIFAPTCTNNIVLHYMSFKRTWNRYSSNNFKDSLSRI